MQMTRFAVAVLIAVAGFAAHAQQPASFYDLKTLSLDGTPGDLAQYKGKVSLVVNVASKCGYTPQYEGLEALQREMKGKGFNVLGFPSNDFGGQEPGSNQQIAQFCQVNYGITFPVFAKTAVVGANANPLYRQLATRTGQPPKWNFHKYLVDRSGQQIAAFESAIAPEDRRLIAQIEKLLAVR